MINNKKFLVCGGDLRQIKLAESLAKDGCSVAVFGFNKDIEFNDEIRKYSNINHALEDIDVIILPLPCSVDDETINMPLSEEKLHASYLLKNISKNQIVVAGRVSDKIHTLADLYKVSIFDYFEREELTILNAIPVVLAI